MKSIFALCSIVLATAAPASAHAERTELASACKSSLPTPPPEATSAAFDAKKVVATILEDGRFTTLANLLDSADLVKALEAKGPFTVFAPTDEAFAKLPKETLDALRLEKNKADLVAILRYHVVADKIDTKRIQEDEMVAATTLNGQRVRLKTVKGAVHVNDVAVATPDVDCTNGLIHVIDVVMLPESKNLVEVASEAKSFRTLLAAAKAAGLDKTLADKGPFTIFAPTDAAFEKLPEGTVEGLLKPENKDELIALLRRHIVLGCVYSNEATKLKEAKRLDGSNLPVKIEKQGTSVGDAKVTRADIQAKNGVIHVVDAVILR